jgi:DNA-binding PadR family transcriptional regulator
MTLRYALLTLLAHRALSGYELLDYFDGSVGFVWYATHPQIYRELGKLREDGLVSMRVVAQSGRPDKKVYATTAAGREALLAWAAEPAPEQMMKDEMMLRVFSFALIDRDVALARLAEHRAAHAERLERYRALHAGLVLESAHPFRTGSLLTLAAGIGYEEFYVRWCDWARAVLSDPRQRGLTRPPGAPARPRRARRGG